MALKVPDVSLGVHLDLLRIRWNVEGPAVASLFAAAHVPVAGDTIAVYEAIKASFSGYIDVDLAFAAPSVDAVNHIARTQAAPAVWVHDGGVGADDIYGYYIWYASAGHHLLWAEEFSGGPFTMANLGDTLSFTPLFTLISQF